MIDNKVLVVDTPQPTIRVMVLHKPNGTCSHMPGETVTASNGKQYVVQRDGSIRRVK